MNHPQMPTYVPMHQKMHLHPQKPETGFLRINLWVSSSETQESASPLTRRELAPEGAVEYLIRRNGVGTCHQTAAVSAGILAEETANRKVFGAERGPERDSCGWNRIDETVYL